MACDRVLVVPNEILYGRRGRVFCGFQYAEHASRDYFDLILNNAQFADKDKVEHDRRLQQIVAWGILVNPSRRQAFVYKRSDGFSDYRLGGAWSFGFGGHVLEKDLDGGRTFSKTISRDLSTGRVELHPESGVSGQKAGFRCDSNLGFVSLPWKVNAYHFGLVYLVNTDAAKITIRGKEFAEARPFNMRQLVELGAKKTETVDDWSNSTWPLMMNLLFHE